MKKAVSIILSVLLTVTVVPIGLSANAEEFLPADDIIISDEQAAALYEWINNLKQSVDQAVMDISESRLDLGSIDTDGLTAETGFIREEYEQLDNNQKILVTNFETLSEIEKTVDDLAEAARVYRMIDDFRHYNITPWIKDSIEAARAEYNALSADQRKLVTNYDILVAAEETLTAYDSLMVGDADRNGTIDLADMLRMLYLIHTEEYTDLDLYVCDINGDATINIADVLHVANIIHSNMSKLGITSPESAASKLHSGIASAVPDSEITVPLYLNNAAALADAGSDFFSGMQLLAEYDTEQLTLTEFTPSEAFKGYNARYSLPDEGGLSLILMYKSDFRFESMKLTGSMTGDTLLGYFTFKTSEAFIDATVQFELQKLCCSSENDTYNADDCTELIGVENLKISRAAYLHAKPQPAVPGRVYRVPVYLNNAAALIGIGDGTIGGIQFTVEYDYEQVRLTGFKGEGGFAIFPADIYEMNYGKHRVMFYNGGYSAYGIKLTEDMGGDLLIGYLEFKVTSDIISTPVHIDIQNICDSSQGEMENAVSYKDYIKAIDFTIEKTEGMIPGDLDGTGVVDVADIMTLKNLIMSGRWSEKQLAAGDIDGNGSLTVSDILAIKNIIMS